MIKVQCRLNRLERQRLLADSKPILKAYTYDPDDPEATDRALQEFRDKYPQGGVVVFIPDDGDDDEYFETNAKGRGYYESR